MILNGNCSDRDIVEALTKLKETMGQTHVNKIRESTTSARQDTTRQDSEGDCLRA